VRVEGRWKDVPYRDQSHKLPEDRTPPRIWENVCVEFGVHWDTAETRANIPALPGKSIARLKKKRSGPVALLFNGASLADFDLYSIKAPMIGMNRTHRGYETYGGPEPDYLCIVDTSWLNREAVRNFPRLINGTTDPRPIGYRTSASYRAARMGAPFSFDLKRDGVIPTTTGWLALQFAVYAGFTDLYCLGLDLGGKHYDQTPSGMNMDAQAKLTALSLRALNERGINVWSLGRSDVFSRGDFERLC
jgi:hypothetical protein